jgi:hypothetical protein
MQIFDTGTQEELKSPNTGLKFYQREMGRMVGKQIRMVSNLSCETVKALDDNGFQGNSYEVSAKSQSLTELEAMQIAVSLERRE